MPSWPPSPEEYERLRQRVRMGQLEALEMMFDTGLATAADIVASCEELLRQPALPETRDRIIALRLRAGGGAPN